MTARRRLGPDGPQVSQLCYGAMRLRETVDGRSAADHLRLVHDAGIDTIHSSHEYDADPILLDALRAAAATGRRFHHIVKLAEPGFDDRAFDGARLEAAVDRRLAELGADTLACVQWLIRTPDPEDEAATVAVIDTAGAAMADTIQRLQATGKVQTFALFPYTAAVAAAALDHGLVSRFTVYLNRLEDQHTGLADRGATLIAIRPLAGGRLIADDPAVTADALRYPLLHPSVATTMVSVNSADHLRAVVEAAGSTAPDRAAFDRLRTSTPTA
ncbi:MAG: hypothetical protein AAF547_17915 [Actinomycetota bacterium]